MAGPNEIEIRIKAQMGETAKVAEGLGQIGKAAEMAGANALKSEGAWADLRREVGVAMPNALERQKKAQEAAFLAMDKAEKLTNAFKAATRNVVQAVASGNPELAKMVGHINGIADGTADSIQGITNFHKATNNTERAMAAASITANAVSVGIEAINLAINQINNNKLTGIHALDEELRKILGLAHETEKAMLEVQFPEGGLRRAQMLARASKILHVEVTDLGQAIAAVKAKEQDAAASKQQFLEQTDRVREAVAKGWAESQKYGNVVDQNIAALKFLAEAKRASIAVPLVKEEQIAQGQKALQLTRDMAKAKEAETAALHEAAQEQSDIDAKAAGTYEAKVGERVDGYGRLIEGAEKAAEATDTATESYEEEGEAAEEAADSKDRLAESEYGVAEGADAASEAASESADSFFSSSENAPFTNARNSGGLPDLGPGWDGVLDGIASPGDFAPGGIDAIDPSSFAQSMAGPGAARSSPGGSNRGSGVVHGTNWNKVLWDDPNSLAAPQWVDNGKYAGPRTAREGAFANQGGPGLGAPTLVGSVGDTDYGVDVSGAGAGGNYSSDYGGGGGGGGSAAGMGGRETSGYTQGPSGQAVVMNNEMLAALMAKLDMMQGNPTN